MTTISLQACQSNINEEKNNSALFGSSPWVLLLCTWLANGRSLSSSQAVWAEYELMHCNMTVIIPLGEPAVLQDSFTFSLESRVSKLPLPLLFLSSVQHPPSSLRLSSAASAFDFSVIPFLLICRQTSSGTPQSHSFVMQLLPGPLPGPSDAVSLN